MYCDILRINDQMSVNNDYFKGINLLGSVLNVKCFINIYLDLAII